MLSYYAIFISKKPELPVIICQIYFHLLRNIESYLHNLVLLISHLFMYQFATQFWKLHKFEIFADVFSCDLSETSQHLHLGLMWSEALRFFFQLAFEWKNEFVTDDSTLNLHSNTFCKCNVFQPWARCISYIKSDMNIMICIYLVNLCNYLHHVQQSSKPLKL